MTMASLSTQRCFLLLFCFEKENRKLNFGWVNEKLEKMVLYSFTFNTTLFLLFFFSGGEWEAEFWFGEGKIGKYGSDQRKHEKF